MAIEIRLFGFGDDRPAAFAGRDLLRLELETPATPWAVLRAAGIDDAEGLVLLSAEQLIPPAQWHDAIIHEYDRLTLLSAFEGG